MEKRKNIIAGAVVTVLMLALPQVLADTPSGTGISGVAIQALGSAFGSPGIFVFAFFVVIAFIQGIFHIPWVISIELFFVTFAMVSTFWLSNYQMAIIIWVMMFTAAGYGFTKLIADLIFA